MIFTWKGVETEWEIRYQVVLFCQLLPIFFLEEKAGAV